MEEKRKQLTRNVVITAFAVAIAGGMGLTLWNSTVAWAQDASAAHLLARKTAVQVEKNQPLIDELDVQNKRMGDVENRLGALESTVNTGISDILNEIGKLNR